MEPKALRQLEEAKTLFYAWRLQEAYGLFRRFFDRIPFKPEPAHAEYIGMFVRILVELGKDYELKFYLKELERWYDRHRPPEVTYSLGVVYRYISPPKWEASRALFESIVKDPEARALHARAKMMLADYYSNRGDVAACRSIVDSIETDDPGLKTLVQIWKSYVLRHEKRIAEAIECLQALLKHLTPESNWYAFFSAKIMIGRAFIESQRWEEARAVILEVQQLFGDRSFKTVMYQLGGLEEDLQRETSLGDVSLSIGLKESIFSYKNRTLFIGHEAPLDRLLVLFVKKRFLDKAGIVKGLFQRQYQAGDDKLIYYHIHSLRKRLKAIGLPAEAIANEGHGYRWVPEVKLVEGEA